MDTDARKAEFARAVVEAQRVLAGMLIEIKTNYLAVAQSRETIQESRDLLRACFDRGGTDPVWVRSGRGPRL